MLEVVLYTITAFLFYQRQMEFPTFQKENNPTFDIILQPHF